MLTMLLLILILQRFYRENNELRCLLDEQRETVNDTIKDAKQKKNSDKLMAHFSGRTILSSF